MRDRQYLAEHEFDQLLKAIPKSSRTYARDRCLLMMMYKHGLRATEACRLNLTQVDLSARVIHVKRMKNGLSLTQPVYPEEIPYIKVWLKARLKQRTDDLSSGPLFLTFTNKPLTRFALFKIVQTAGKIAGFPFPVHPHMLRHSCGYALANRGADTRIIQDFLGHTQIQSTVRYTTVNPRRFERLWS
jgi:type 1 fimbriae regulatory protein FimB